VSAHKFSHVYCSVCGKSVGKTKGVVVVNDLVCEDPICNAQTPPSPNEQRDAFIVAAALAGVAISQIAFATQVSRQRIYQIIDGWKKGI
jgi:hypothetical protein